MLAQTTAFSTKLPIQFPYRMPIDQRVTILAGDIEHHLSKLHGGTVMVDDSRNRTFNAGSFLGFVLDLKANAPRGPFCTMSSSLEIFMLGNDGSMKEFYFDLTSIAELQDKISGKYREFFSIKSKSAGEWEMKIVPNKILTR